MKLPRLYAIMDRKPNSSIDDLQTLATELLAAGVTLFQYRDKQGTAARMLLEARELKRLALASAKPSGITLIMNDRADIGVAAGLDGVHLGQEDLSAEAVRALCASPRIIGLSTHNVEQMEAADATSADYIAFGPVFETTSKCKPDAVVGIEGLRAARKKTKKPLVAIGGITMENCRQAIDAGADSVAVISALTKEPRRTAEEFLRRMG